MEQATSTSFSLQDYFPAEPGEVNVVPHDLKERELQGGRVSKRGVNSQQCPAKSAGPLKPWKGLTLVEKGGALPRNSVMQAEVKVKWLLCLRW